MSIWLYFFWGAKSERENRKSGIYKARTARQNKLSVYIFDSNLPNILNLERCGKRRALQAYDRHAFKYGVFCTDISPSCFRFANLRLNPLESGHSFKYDKRDCLSLATKLSQSPRIGAFLQIHTTITKRS